MQLCGFTVLFLGLGFLLFAISQSMRASPASMPDAVCVVLASHVEAFLTFIFERFGAAPLRAPRRVSAPKIAPHSFVGSGSAGVDLPTPPLPDATATMLADAWNNQFLTFAAHGGRRFMRRQHGGNRGHARQFSDRLLGDFTQRLERIGILRFDCQRKAHMHAIRRVF